MSTAALVPVFAPDGTVRQIPQEQVSAALTNGGQRAALVADPQGVHRYIPESQVNNAVAAGGRLYSPTADDLMPKWYGFTPSNVASNVWQGAKGMVTGAYQLGKDLVNNPDWVTGPNSTYEKFVGAPAAAQAEQASALWQQPGIAPKIQAAGHELAGALPLVGPWAANLGTQAGTGDIGGAAGQAAGTMLGAKGISTAINLPARSLERFGPGISRAFNNAVVRPAARDFQFGKNPSLGVAEEGIVGASRESVLAKVTAQKQAIGQQIGDILTNSPDKDINIPSTVGDTIDAEIAKAVSQGDQGYVNQLQDIRQRWTSTFAQDAQGNVVPTAKLTDVNPTVANQLKQRIGDDTNWNPMTNPYADQLNRLQVRVYRNLNSAIEDAAPGTRALNSRYANLLTAEKGLRRAMLNDMRAPAPSGMSILTSPMTTPLGTAGTTGIAAALVGSPLTRLLGKGIGFGAASISDVMRRYLGLEP